MDIKEYLTCGRTYLDRIGLDDWVLELHPGLINSDGFFFASAAAQTDIKHKIIKISEETFIECPKMMVDAFPHEAAHAIQHPWTTDLEVYGVPDWHDFRWQQLAQRLGGSGGDTTSSSLVQPWQNQFSSTEEAFAFILEKGKEYRMRGQ